MRTTRGRAALCTVWAAAIALLPVEGGAQATRRSTPAKPKPAAPTVPPEAAEAFDRGLEAAQEGQWDAAIEHLTAAQRSAPFASPILLNLGLAHARAGHDLAAIAWLHAYLAAPGARDAEAVRGELGRLKALAEGRASRIAQASQELLQELESQGLRAGRVRDYASLMARPAMQAGDLAGAKAILAAIEDVTDRDDVWAEVATSLTERPEDLEMARQAAEEIQDPSKRAAALSRIAEAEARTPARESVAPSASVRQLAEWEELARFLSARDEVVHLDLELKKAADAEALQVPLRLTRVATSLASDYLRIRRLQERYAPSAQR